MERWQSPVECTRLEIEQGAYKPPRGFESLSLRHILEFCNIKREQDSIFFALPIALFCYLCYKTERYQRGEMAELVESARLEVV